MEGQQYAKPFPGIFVVKGLLHHVYGLLIWQIRCAVHDAHLNLARVLGSTDAKSTTQRYRPVPRCHDYAAASHSCCPNLQLRVRAHRGQSHAFPVVIGKVVIYKHGVLGEGHQAFLHAGHGDPASVCTCITANAS